MKREATQSAYMKIHYEIANEIAMGIYKPGDLLPTHTELSQKYNVSRVTISEAIKELSRRGILRTQKGKGTFVVGSPMEIGNFQRFEGFSKFSNQNKDRNLTSRVIVNDIVPAPVRVAELLEIPADTPMVNIIRVRSVDGIPMSYESSFLKQSYVGMIDFTKENLETGSLYAVLREKAGISFGYSKEKLRATYCPEKVSGYLGLNQMEPVLFVNRVCGMDEKQLVECVEIYERSDISYTSFQSSRSGEEGREKEIVPVARTEMQNKIADCLIGAALANELYDGSTEEKQQFIKLFDKLQEAGMKEPSELAVQSGANAEDGLPEDLMRALLLGMGASMENAVERTAGLFINRYKDKSMVMAACALAAAMNACMESTADTGALMEKARYGAAKGLELARLAGMEERTINVEKRIEFAENIAKEHPDWKDAMVAYQDIFGLGTGLDNIVPAVLCALSVSKRQYAAVIRDSKEYLLCRTAAILFGALAGAYYSRMTFSDKDTSVLGEGKLRCYGWAETVCGFF